MKYPVCNNCTTSGLTLQNWYQVMLPANLSIKMDYWTITPPTKVAFSIQMDCLTITPPMNVAL
eukprot:14294219-Ditylum_brightwellii.AAC.1